MIKNEELLRFAMLHEQKKKIGRTKKTFFLSIKKRRKIFRLENKKGFHGTRIVKFSKKISREEEV